MARLMSMAGFVLPLSGVLLALANWTASPDKAWAWTVAIVIFLVMAIVRLWSQRGIRRSSEDAASAQVYASVSRTVVVAAVMMVIPLAVTLAHAYGLVSDRDLGLRATMIILGAYLAAVGNNLPRMLPPVASMPGNAADIQAFQRFAGRAWVLGGLGFAIAWLALPIDTAVPVSAAVVAAALIGTVLQLLRLRKPGQGAPSLG
jgi:hypothetical protein